MAILHLMVGLPCSGKTTLAKQLEKIDSVLRMTPDEWHLCLYGQDIAEEQHEQRHDYVEALLWNVAARALILGIDVILDYGFWLRCQREDFRLRAEKIGVRCVIHYTEASRETLLIRLKERNACPPKGAFHIPEEKLQQWIALFEPPTEDEAGFSAPV